MQQDITDSKVMADFYICAKHLNFDKINSVLMIANPKERSRESFCYEEFAKDYWSVDTGYRESNDVNEQINMILDVLRSKLHLIREIVDEFNAECGFVITIKSDFDSLPAIYFEQDLINIAAQLGATINLDLT